MRCLNWKVIAALAGVGVVIYALAPGVAAAAVPLLVVAVCPLSMLLMMRAMGSMGSCARQRDTGDGDEEAFAWYVRGPHRSRADSSDAAAMRSELAAFRHQQSDPFSDKSSGRA